MSIKNFTAYNPTRLHFGEGVIDKLGKVTFGYGKKALFLYGKGSAVKFGYYDQVMDQLKSAGLNIVEYSGIKPNPIIEDVREASLLAKKHKVDVIVALGGGSVIDSAKIIALSVATGEDGWDIMKHKVTADKALPLVCILTLAATGTEMNAAAVVQNHQTGEKIGYVNPETFPKESFLDPSFTVSVPKNYTAYGIVDLIAHALEVYFGEGEPSVIDDFTFAIIKDAMKAGPELLSHPENVDLRAKIMLDATLALNGITSYGKKGGDWGVHSIGHELSLLFDTPHGATLSIAYPAWLRLHKDRCPGRISKLGKNLFGTESVDETIDGITKFFQQIQSPVNLSEAKIPTGQKQAILTQMSSNQVSGSFHKLAKNDLAKLVDFML
jgi:hypothetical protein